MATFTGMLLKISGQLSERDVNDLKFLCREDIVKKKMETIREGTDLFSQLLEQALISEDDLSFLIKLLDTIKRRDLVEVVEKFQTPLSRQETGQEESQERDQLDLAFDIICDNVGRDWKMLMRKLGVADAVMDQIVYANPYNMQEQIRQSLREWRKKKRTSASVSALMKALVDCRMRLVAEKLTNGLNLSHGES